MQLGIRDSFAGWAGRACAWGLRTVLHRSASTLPGRVAMALDPGVLGSLADKVTRGSVVVCGTNGKTTTNNVLARAIEESGMSVFCNRAGANMESGVVTALLPAGRADWGVFENDELSTVRVVPRVRPRYFVLLNLFRDQLDRCGELDRIQQTIGDALAASPETVLVYNADDPLCESVALRFRASGGRTMGFGIDEDLHLPGDRVAGGAFCQRCSSPLSYAYRQYGQLGKYVCPACGFGRPELAFSASNVEVGVDGVAFDAHVRTAPESGDAAGTVRLRARWGGTYMVYNLLAAYAAASLVGVGAEAFQRVLDSYAPENGRLQRLEVRGRQVTLNLAKNPTGYNQNIAMLMGDPAPKIVYIVINDDYNDGRDVSWLWDVDFERLAQGPECRVFAGGTRANDMQVRLKYADIDAAIAGDVAEVLDAAGDLPSNWHLWVLPNYSALSVVKAELEGLGAER